MMEVVNFKDRAGQITELYEYNLVSRVNNHTFTIVKVADRTLDFHVHPDSDEAFYIVEGTMQLELRDRIVDLKEGDLFVVPKGTEHRPVCTTPVTCMLIEADGTMTPENSPGTRRNCLK